MIRTTITIRRNLDGALMGAAVSHVDGRVHFIGPDVTDLKSAVAQAAAELESTYAGMPAPILDRAAWLAVLSSDRRVKRTALRVAGLIAAARSGHWQGLASLGNRLTVDYRNIARAIRRLVALGYIEKSYEDQRAFYRPMLPGGGP